MHSWLTFRAAPRSVINKAASCLSLSSSSNEMLSARDGEFWIFSWLNIHLLSSFALVEPLPEDDGVALLMLRLEFPFRVVGFVSWLVSFVVAVVDGWAFGFVDDVCGVLKTGLLVDVVVLIVVEAVIVELAFVVALADEDGVLAWDDEVDDADNCKSPVVVLLLLLLIVPFVLLFATIIFLLIIIS